MKNIDPEKKKQIVLVGILIIIITVSLIVIFKKIMPQPDVYYADENADTGFGTSVSIKEEKIKIDVEGAVKKPGLKVLNRDEDRIDDAIKAAGGFTKYADTSQVNLAKRIFDGEKIVIPVYGQDLVIEGDQGRGNDESFGIKVNINTATSEELQKLPGIGPAYAERIIEYRNSYGKFTSINQLLEIKGIGEKKLERMKDNITL